MPHSFSIPSPLRRLWALIAVFGAVLLSSVLVISANAATLSITTTTVHEGALGQTYDPVTLTATGGSSPYLWSVMGGSSSLPAGLSLSSAGVISGTPTALANTTFIVIATDNTSNTATKSLTINVNPDVVVQTAALPPAPVSTSYPPTQLVATGGTGSYTWAVVGGALSPLSLSAAGVVTGTTPASATTINFTVEATDTAGHKDQQVLSITIGAAGALTVTTASLPNGVQNALYPTQTVTASGGTLPYTWTLDSGTLPTGLAPLSSAGAISGTPTATGTFNFTVKVTDGLAATATKSFTINVMAPVDITTVSPLSAATAGAPYSAVLAASGGTPPYTWAATPPATLAMSATTGAITGTATTAGTTTFSVQVTDFLGYAKSEDFSLTVNAAVAPNITTTSLPNALASADYTQQILKTGGLPSDTWSLTGAPAWLAINASTGLLTGTAPATLGSSTFTVQVTGTAGTDTQQLSITVSNVAQQPSQPNVGNDDHDEKDHGLCNAFFRGSHNKWHATAFRRLIDAAGATGDMAQVEAKVRTFCDANGGFWHSQDRNDDDDDSHEVQSSNPAANSGGLGDHAKSKGKSGGHGRSD